MLGSSSFLLSAKPTPAAVPNRITPGIASPPLVSPVVQLPQPPEFFISASGS